MALLFDTHLISGLLMAALPIALGFFLTRRFRLGWRLWWIGAAGFLLSQVGHIPFNGLVNNLFLNGTLPMDLGENALFAAAFGGLSAGLWEELTRAAIFKYWAKDARSWRKGVLLGAGHGGIEAFVIAMLVLFNFAYLAATRGMDLSAMVPPEQLALAQQQVEAYWSTPWSLNLLGALERALALPLHIAFSVLVLQAFTRGQRGWIALAVLWHAAVDGVIVYLQLLWRGQPWAPYGLEGVLAVFTLISIFLIFALRRPEPAAKVETSIETPLPDALAMDEIQVEPTSEDLDSTRFA